MLRRLFRKTRPEDLRAHYRRALGKGVALGVQVMSTDGLPISGALVDLSAGGASIEFGEGIESQLCVGMQRELIFSSLTSRPVRVQATVRTTPTAGEPRRYGFQFIDEDEFHGVLEQGFFKFFNRRKLRRAHPALGESLAAEMTYGGVTWVVNMHDISLRGATFHLDATIAQYLIVGSALELRFDVPKTDVGLVYDAVVRNMTAEAKGVRVGVEMEVASGWESKRNVKRAVATLGDYIDRRVREMERYNSAYN
ncbi:MAG: PilZ domain-containing protein [Planctomycetota bacterium]